MEFLLGNVYQDGRPLCAADVDASQLLAFMPLNWHHAGLFGFIGRTAGMADISIIQQHSLSPDAARSAAQKVADKLAGEYGLHCEWEGDVLRFERSGVEGSLALHERQAALRIKLGILMSAFASTIEQKVGESMRKVFAG
jgi:putative polyhydroxyalkanoate system protein